MVRVDVEVGCATDVFVLVAVGGKGVFVGVVAGVLVRVAVGVGVPCPAGRLQALMYEPASQ